MENSNCFPGSRYPQWPYPWPFPFPFPFPDQFPPYLLSIANTGGSSHNALLDEYAVAFPAFDGTREQMWNVMINGTTRLTKEVGMTDGSFPSFKVANDFATKIKANLDKVLNEMVKSGEMTPYIAEQTQIMLAIIKDARSFEVADRRLVAFSNRISFNTGVSVNDKIILTFAASTAISTNDFWSEALVNAASPYHDVAVNIGEANLFKIKWADVIGFVVGAVVGGAAGGPVTGVTTGIALGGFASEAFGEK